MNTRRPAVAGQFYAGSFESLEKEIKSCFLSKFGPGKLPKRGQGKGQIIAGIVPHAGYSFSGPCASFLYRELSLAKKPDAFVILGPNHNGIGEPIAITSQSWETPFGIINVENEIAHELMKSGLIKYDDSAHGMEHSIEVQIPFLQFIFGNDFKIVPIAISHENLNYEQCQLIGREIANAAMKLGKKVIIIASSDMTHYGANYGYLPFTENVKKNMYAFDRKAISRILKLDCKDFTELVIDKGMTICGAAGIGVMLAASKILAAKSGKLLKYYTSGDIANDYENAVGYASIIIK